MTEVAARPSPAAAPIGPGRLVLVVGPSGAGKDTILRGAKDACAGDASIVFPRRVVTREATGDESHDSMNEADFAAAARAGTFALSWEAHGLCYGVPHTINADVRLGRGVVCNVSRGIVASARTLYANVTSVLVTAPADVLAARLAARARAADASLAARIERNSNYSGFSADVVINNDGAAEDAVAIFVDFLRNTPAA